MAQNAGETVKAGMNPALATAIAAVLLAALTTAAFFWPHAQTARALGVAQVAAGDQHTCVIGPGVGVKCWGGNGSGELGNGGYAQSSVPVDVSGLTSHAVMVSAGLAYTCAIKSLSGVNSALCWGENNAGQLGYGSIGGTIVTPIPVVGLAAAPRSITTGDSHTCAVLVGNGVQCWGDNSGGELGDGTNTTSASPVPATPIAGYLQVSAGSFFTCGLTTGTAAKCWGSNSAGNLGNGSVSSSSTPVSVSGLSSDVDAVAAGGTYACALYFGGVQCWGDNTAGQLGDGGACSTPCTTPVSVTGLPGTATSIAAGFAHACARITTGALYCWGSNISGQLGNGATGGISTTPVLVAGPSDVISVSAGTSHTCVVTALANIRCWGANGAGQLGTGAMVPYATPVTVVASVKATPPPPACPITDNPIPAAGCSYFNFTASLIVIAPPAIPTATTCTITGEESIQRSALTVMPTPTPEQISFTVLSIAGSVGCPGPLGSGSSITSGGIIKEVANTNAGTLDMPVDLTETLCLRIDSIPFGMIANCPDGSPPSAKHPLRLNCPALTSLSSFTCSVDLTPPLSDFHNSNGATVATILGGHVDVVQVSGPQPPPSVGGVGLTPSLGQRSGSSSGAIYIALAGAAIVLLALVAGTVYARKRIRPD